ncbi:MAG: Gfo/Idh/MocA family oxidoreductase [Planctomycetes bacterium]|nr:Gfo/Idh/MocA family oxidoreductase [Planctomycetota bacterium]
MENKTTTGRRDFLKSLTAGGLAGGWAMSFAALPAHARVLGANDRIEAGMIGVGGRGTHLLQMVLKRPDAAVVGISDAYEKRQRAAGALAREARLYGNFRELLDRPGLDAVFIATPDHWHAPMSLAALAKGLDVYCEKPMTLTVEEAKEVHRAVQASKSVFQVGVQSTSWSKWWKVKAALEKGMLGKIVCCQSAYNRNEPGGTWNYKIDPKAGPEGRGEDHIDWEEWLGSAPRIPFSAERFFRFRKYWDYSGGIATDLHYHNVAPFHLAIRNDFPSRVAGMGGIWAHKDGREVPDTFLTAADYPGEYSMIIPSTMANRRGSLPLIRGEEATLVMGDDWEGEERDRIEIIPEEPFQDSFRKKWGQDRVLIDKTANEGDQLHVDNFFECVRSRKRPNCDAELAYKVMVTIGLSVRSYREGKMFYWDAAREAAVDSKPA